MGIFNGIQGADILSPTNQLSPVSGAVGGITDPQQSAQLAAAIEKLGTAQNFGANLSTAKFGLGALGAGFDIYAGLKNLGLAKKQFNFNRSLANRNLANQAATTNLAIDKYGYNKLAGTGLNAQDLAKAVESYVARNKVDGSPI